MPKGPTSHTYISQRLKLHYVDWGNSEAPPLLLLHGGRDHCRSWDWVAQELSRDWHVICPDLRGHGDSEWCQNGDYNRTNYIYDLAQLIHQKQLAPINLVAHSMGGIIATCYTGLFPEYVRKLALIDGIGFSSGYQDELDQEPIKDRLHRWIDQRRELSARLPHRYDSLAAAMNRMQAANSYLSAEQLKHLTEHAVSQNEDGSFSWKFDHYVRLLPPLLFSKEQLHEMFASIDCPVQVFWGKDSFLPVPDPNSWQFQTLNDVQMTVYDNAGHWLQHDQTDRFIGDLKAFLTRE